MKTLFVLLMTISVFGAVWYGGIDASAASESQVIFFVHWYDVGKSALEGLKGVKSVKSGFRKHREINTVIYDPDMITPEEMVSVLKDSGTYLGTAED